MLFQLDEEGNERPISYISQKLNAAQKNYTITELECLAAVNSVKKFRPYIDGTPFTIITDHMSLKWLMGQKDLSGRLARWSLKLQAYDFDIVHRKGAKNVVPDVLSRMHMEEIDSRSLSTDISLDDVEFQSESYRSLVRATEVNAERLPDVKVMRGVIYKRDGFRKGDEDEDLIWKIWVPEGLRETLLKKVHDGPSAGHGGMTKTLNRLRSRYYWPGMVASVKSFVGDCDVCKRCKVSNTTSRPLMGGRTVTERAFQRLYVDFCGPYPRSRDGNSYVFVVLDHFSKFLFLKPMRNATAKEVARYLEADVFHVFGVPEVIHSDNGRQFVSELFTNFLARYGVRHVKTAVYSPQANASERVNRSLLAIIRSYIEENEQRSWDRHVSEAAFALRSAVHEAIGAEPYRVVFGQTMVQHGETYPILRSLGEAADSDTVITPKDVRLRLLRDKVTRNLKLAYEKGQRAYNTRAKPRSFAVGQVVYRRSFRQSDATQGFNAKLASKFTRAVVVKRVGQCLYQLADFQGRSIGIFHAKDLKV